eukprot:5799797-Amphidinium_carterae.1
MSLSAQPENRLVQQHLSPFVGDGFLPLSWRLRNLSSQISAASLPLKEDRDQLERPWQSVLGDQLERPWQSVL